MIVTVDANVLARVIADDEPRESAIARRELEQAEKIIVPLVVLCELVWVLARGYRRKPTEIATTLRRLIDADTVIVDREAAEIGIDLLESGGDFADAVIAFEGARAGADTLITFDKKAVQRVAARGISVRLLG